MRAYVDSYALIEWLPAGEELISSFQNKMFASIICHFTFVIVSVEHMLSIKQRSNLIEVNDDIRWANIYKSWL